MLPAAALIQKLRSYSDAEVTAALGAAGGRRLQKFLTNVHSYQRALRPPFGPPPNIIWQRGTTRLLDYGRFCPPGREGPALLLIPSLVNRAYVLDLSAEASFVRWLAARGVRCFVVDWQAPGPEERGFGLSDYITARLQPALQAVREAAGAPPFALGYCMGGLLLAGLLSQLPDQNAVRGQLFLATPWDFAAGFPHLRPLYQAAAPVIDRYFARHATLAVDVLQLLFLTLDPFQAARKFLEFDGRAAQAGRFVALEDWLNNGVPLAGPVARQCLVDWYGHNAPASGQWQVAGHTVAPAGFTQPSFVVIPQQDRIVPPESALPLARQLPAATTLTPPLGHIGLMASRRAAEEVWTPLWEWLRSE